MERRKGIMDRLIEEADLPGELLPGQSVVELAGDRRVLIENPDRVKSVCGSGMGLWLFAVAEWNCPV